MSARRGRPPKPLAPEASSTARLGAEVRARRLTGKLTQQALGGLVGYTAQYVSEVERAKTPPTRPFIAACDDVLNAHGVLLVLLPAALEERELARQERATARRTAREPALGCGSHSDAGDDVDPTDRRGLIGAAGAGVLGLSTAAPSAAREVDPELPAHCTRLLGILDRHDEAFGPREVLGVVLHELRQITEHRQVARGKLRAELLRVEACWAAFAAWLSNDAGDVRHRGAWTDRALWLAEDAAYHDMAALAHMRRSQWATLDRDAGRAVAHAEAGLSVSGASSQVRAMCELQAAHALALAGNAAVCERHLAAAQDLVGQDDGSPARPWGACITYTYARGVEAACWLELEPRRAIGVYETVLQEWPRERVSASGVLRARLAQACAAAGELERARAEGRKAFAIARATGSSVAAGELRRLRQALAPV
jgi:transcriptional regulator with XRE-family HTH domain